MTKGNDGGKPWARGFLHFKRYILTKKELENYIVLYYMIIYDQKNLKHLKPSKTSRQQGHKDYMKVWKLKETWKLKYLVFYNFRFF
jgi:hypothetical protein